MSAPCFECSAPSVHNHHVVPRSLGGTHTVALCEACHGKVHGVDLHISSLTKAALKSAKARGVRLGAPDMAKLGVDVQAVADVYSRFRTLGATSAELNRLGVPTAKGARWHPRTVSIALKSQKAVDIPLPSE